MRWVCLETKFCSMLCLLLQGPIKNSSSYYGCLQYAPCQFATDDAGTYLVSTQNFSVEKFHCIWIRPVSAPLETYTKSCIFFIQRGNNLSFKSWTWTAGLSWTRLIKMNGRTMLGSCPRSEKKFSISCFLSCPPYNSSHWASTRE